jgi:hypothetical protein
MKSLFASILVALVLLSSCVFQQKIITRPLDQLQSQEIPGIIYALPRTTIEIGLKLERTLFVPGPYAGYAKKYLGIEGARETSYSQWNILDAKATSFEEADPAQYYVITGIPSNADFSTLTSLRADGFVVEPGAANEKTGNLSIPENIDKPWFLNLSNKDHIRERTDTLYKTIFEDSILVRIPVFRKVNEIKTEEDRAKEVAHLIHKIRKRRIKMISADYPVLPQGEALAVSLKELNRAEAEYLSLFIGKTFRDTLEHHWNYLPDLQSQTTYELCKFSEEDGILPVSAEDGQSIGLLVKSLGRTVELPVFVDPGINSLFYRIPDLASLELKMGIETLISRQLRIYQFGKLIPLGLPGVKKAH